MAKEPDLSLAPHTVTVMQYAQAHGLNPITVRQWIRRGKLPEAKKLGILWVIPEGTQIPTRRNYKRKGEANNV